MASEKNALAELAEEAEELKHVLEDLKFDRRVVVCDKLQRIVSEMAKYGDVTPPFLNMKSVFENCRAIAEEGLRK